MLAPGGPAIATPIPRRRLAHRRAPVVVVPEPAIVQALKSNSGPSPEVEVRLPDGQIIQGMVLLQVVTSEGLLLLEARAHGRAPNGNSRMELMPLDPSVRAWLEAQT